MKIIKKTLFIFLSAAPVSFCAVFCCCSLKEQNGGDANVYIDGPGNISADFTARGNISLYVDKTPGFNDSDVTKCFDDVKAHYDALNEKTPVSAPVAMVILSDENILSRYVLAEKGGAVLNDGRIICSLSGFENKGYLPALAGARLNTTESWKQTAAADYFFKTPNSSDLSALKDYYEDKNHHLALTLFEGYFCKAFASENDIGIAVKTAVCFGRYIIDNYGISALCNASLTDYRGEWLAALGIKTPFTIEYDLSWLNGARYSVKFFSYPLVIETADRVVYPDSVKTDRESSSFYTPELVLRHLSEGIRGTEQIMRYLSSVVKDAGLIKELEGNIRAKTQYYISENISSSEADVNGRKVFLSDPSEFVHETMHILTLDENTAEGAYLAEGVAEFLSREICEIPSDINYRMYYSFIDDAPLYGSMKDFVYDVKTQFFSLGGTFADFDSFKFYLLEQAVARTTLSKPRYKLSIDFAYATMSINDVRRFPADFPGNDLTYPEVYLFVRYLIDNYGIDKVLACCLNYGFETFFNQMFDEAFVLFASSL